MRIGYGEDTHRLETGRKLILGGVEIPYEKGLLGYSDADVLLHAIMDALLGAMAMGDIGRRFPDDDPKYKGVSSRLLLENVYEAMRCEGYSLGNIDAVVIAQRPKLAPYMEQMRESIAEILHAPQSAVNIKASTTEGCGPEGRGECMTARAVCILENDCVQ